MYQYNTKNDEVINILSTVNDVLYWKDEHHFIYTVSNELCAMQCNSEDAEPVKKHIKRYDQDIALGDNLFRITKDRWGVVVYKHEENVLEIIDGHGDIVESHTFDTRYSIMDVYLENETSYFATPILHILYYHMNEDDTMEIQWNDQQKIVIPCSHCHFSYSNEVRVVCITDELQLFYLTLDKYRHFNEEIIANEGKEIDIKIIERPVVDYLFYKEDRQSVIIIGNSCIESDTVLVYEYGLDKENALTLLAKVDSYSKFPEFKYSNETLYIINQFSNRFANKILQVHDSYTLYDVTRGRMLANNLSINRCLKDVYYNKDTDTTYYIDM